MITLTKLQKTCVGMGLISWRTNLTADFSLLDFMEKILDGRLSSAKHLKAHAKDRQTAWNKVSWSNDIMNIVSGENQVPLITCHHSSHSEAWWCLHGQGGRKDWGEVIEVKYKNISSENLCLCGQDLKLSQRFTSQHDWESFTNWLNWRAFIKKKIAPVQASSL